MLSTALPVAPSDAPLDFAPRSKCPRCINLSVLWLANTKSEHEYQSPPPLGGRDRHFAVLPGNIYCVVFPVAFLVCVPHLSHTRSCIAFPLPRISHLCVFCDILSPKAVYRVLCPFFRTTKMFSPSDRVWYRSRTLGPITPMASQSQTPAVCLHQCRVPQLALKCPGNLPPRGGRPSLGDPPPPPEGETVARYGGRFQGGGINSTSRKDHHFYRR